MTRFLAVGIGCRKGVSGKTIVGLVRQAIAAAPLLPQAGEGQDSPLPLAEEGLGVRVSPLFHLFTLADKADEPGLVEAARLLGAPLTGLASATLHEQRDRILTPSPAARARFGIDSVAEAAALAGAGPGGALLGPRLAADGLTCAIALSADTP